MVPPVGQPESEHSRECSDRCIADVRRPEAHVEEQSASSPRTRSLRAPGWLYKPAALRSLDVCLDSNGPFIDVSFFVSL